MLNRGDGLAQAGGINIKLCETNRGLDVGFFYLLNVPKQPKYNKIA